ncbi:MAG: type II toxin-antitoxin system ParD family antitoxin [Oscillatoria sp. SIO1A7]|nr:type II toxin-antitoxin system ParD family antitoxin [Oscillatoria sp. SIO1A7]
MNVLLTPELEQLVEERIKAGKYSSAIEVIREALWLLEERDYSDRLSQEEMRKEIAIGTEELKRGEVADGEEVFRELYENIRRFVAYRSQT